MLEIKNLSFGYEEVPVLKDFSLTADKGEILLIEGENGAGKTTLLKCITGLIYNGAGIFYNNEEIIENRNLIRKFSYIMSEDTLYDYMTFDENISFFCDLYDEDSEYLKRAYNMVEELGLLKYKSFLVKNLSLGTRNKLYLIIQFCKKSEMLILDEPFVALDITSQEYFINAIKLAAKNKLILVVTHIKEFKDISTRRVLIEKY